VRPKDGKFAQSSAREEESLRSLRWMTLTRLRSQKPAKTPT
jgi:hypothetical protein